jgi:hypothetical protein
MKTMYGVTYAQLNNLTASELNEHMAVFTANQVREAILKVNPAENKDDMEKFLSIYMKYAVELYNEILTDELYAKQRYIYDTEERFNVAADMSVHMGNLSILVQQLMEKVLDELHNG